MKHWNFEKVIDGSFENVNCIHPLKQAEVYSIVEAAKQDKGIVRIIVFGSSARFDCHSGSDIDIFVERSDDKYKDSVDYSKIDSDVDVIFKHNCGDKLLEEIMSKGVEVYRNE